MDAQSSVSPAGPLPTVPSLPLDVLVAALQSSASGVTIADLGRDDAPLVWVNDAFLHMTGYAAADVLGRNCRFLQGELRDEQAETRARMRAALRDGERCTVLLRNFRKDGSAFWNEFTLQVMGGWAVGLQLDVSARVELESRERRHDHERRRIFDSIADGTLLLQDGRVAHVDDTGLRMLRATSASQLLGERFERLLPPGAMPGFDAWLAGMAAGEQPDTLEQVCLRLDGTRFMAEISGLRVPLAGGWALQLQLRDAGLRRQERDLLEHERWALELIARGAPLPRVLDQLCVAVEREVAGARCAVLLADAAGETLRHGAAPSLPIGYSMTLDGTPIREGMGACGTAAARRAEVVCPDIATDPLWETLGTAALSHGLQACWALPFYLADGGVAGVYAVFHPEARAPQDDAMRIVRATARLAEIAVQQARLHDALRTMALQDTLTGLPNRRAVSEALERALDALRAGTEGGALAKLVIDLDGFKQVNDTLGHHAGDLLLREVAHRFEAALPEGVMLGRRSGDEFVVVAPGADAVQARAIAQRLLDALARPFVVQHQELHVGASIGAAVFPLHGRDEAELFRHADAAMYEAKRGGRNRFVLHEPQQGQQAVGRITLARQLEQALARRELEVHYQPRVAAADGRVSGVEALVRWRHPDLGLLPPMEFVPLAEDTGLILPIGEWVLEQACAQCVTWQREGAAGLQLSVNVSPRQYDQRFLTETVPRMLARTGMPAACLELEITESTMLDRGPAVADALHRLRREGVRVLLDDFGTGHSSLSRLHAFELDGIKIDASFVARLPDAPDAAAILQSLLAMARDLRLFAVAEGVETPGQRDWLLAAGCDELQGYLLGRPVPPAAMSRHLQASRRDMEEMRRILSLRARPRRTLHPVDEARRLEALHRSGLMDDAPHPVMDATVRFMARMLEMPMALVSLVDADRQIFRASEGVEGLTGTPRDISFCGHAIAGAGVMVVDDALAHPDFADNPLVTGFPGIRFYAGAAITAPDGEGQPRRVGTLCVLDRRPRTLAPAQLRLLQETARMLSEALAERR